METKYIIFFALSLNICTIQADEKSDILESNFDFMEHRPICNSSGVSCLNCWTSLNCIDLKNGTFYPNLQHCTIGKSCRNSTGACESEGNYECFGQGKFQCNTEGVFPSPFNSIEYFTCVKGPENTLLKFDSQCNSSTSKFNPSAKLCSKKQNGDKSISSYVPICKHENETRRIDSNPNIFYRCEMDTVDIGFNLVPQLYGCPLDLSYNGLECNEYSYAYYG